MWDYGASRLDKWVVEEMEAHQEAVHRRVSSRPGGGGCRPVAVAPARFGGGLRTRQGRRQASDTAQIDAAGVQATRTERKREHDTGERPERGPSVAARRAFQGFGAKLQFRHYLQGRGGHRRWQAHDAGLWLTMTIVWGWDLGGWGPICTRARVKIRPILYLLFFRFCWRRH